jgi:hypothetical protein
MITILTIKARANVSVATNILVSWNLHTRMQTQNAVMEGNCVHYGKDFNIPILLITCTLFIYFPNWRFVKVFLHLIRFIFLFALQYVCTRTEGSCPAVRAPDLHSGWSGFKSWPGDYLEVWPHFSQLLQENSGRIPQINHELFLLHPSQFVIY